MKFNLEQIGSDVNILKVNMKPFLGHRIDIQGGRYTLERSPLERRLDDKLVYLDVVPSTLLQSRIINPPPRICNMMSDNLRSLPCKMTIPVSPRFQVVFSESIHVSLLVGKRDSNKVACIIDKYGFNYVDGPA